MISTDYVLSVRPIIVKHGTGLPAWFGDYDDATGEQDIRAFNLMDAMAASGDCFITLATRLDKIAQGLPQDSAEQIEIEHLVKTLFYLQDNWSLIAKK